MYGKGQPTVDSFFGDGNDSFIYHGAVLENTSYFTVLTRWPDEVRLLTIEWEMIETAAEALAAVRQNDKAILVFRHDPDAPRRDVSEDIARAWLDDLKARGFDPEQDALPPFIRQHLGRAMEQSFPLELPRLMETLFGTEHAVTLGQECARAVLVFIYGLVMLRISGRRTFASWSALDIIISIVAGSSLSRAMTGNAPLLGTLAAVAVLVLLHLLLAYAVAGKDWLSRLIEGGPVVLAEDGVVHERTRLWHMISHSDIAEALRDHELEGLKALPHIKRLQLEPNGKISVIKEQ